MAGNPPNVPTENIDEVILRLLALEPNEVDELDYETYRQYLKELLIQINTGRKIGGDEAELIRDEFKRVRGKKGRFKIKSKKTKVTANGLGLGGIRKQVKGAQQRIMLMPVGGIPKSGKEVKEKVETVSKKPKVETDPLIRISKTLDSIIKTLTDINKENRKKSEKDRKDAENRRRGGREKDLESQRFEGIKKAISNITKPFQSIWDRIVNFITNIVLGRIVIKLLDWFADPKNQGKINSLIRFFSDHWPVLLAAYLRFGTGIGRFIGKLTGIVIKGAIKLGAVTAKLLASVGLKRFGAVASFLGGPRGRLLGAGLSAAATVGGTLALGKGIENFSEGETKVPAFSGGGATFKGMMSGAGFGPLGMLLGAGIGSGIFNRLIKGPGGPKGDKIPAMLSDGEFVMSAGAVRKYGVDTLEAMNAAGGGTNVPKVADGVTYAAGGGYIEKADGYAKELYRRFSKGKETDYPGGGGTGGFLSTMNFLQRVVGEAQKIAGSELKQSQRLVGEFGSYGQRAFGQASQVISPTINYTQRVAGQASKLSSPAISYAQRVAGQATKMSSPALNYAQRVAGQAKKRISDPIVSAISKVNPGKMTSQLEGSLNSIKGAAGAAEEAIPALIGGLLGMNRTDTNISEDMQRALLQARKTAGKRGRDYVDYKDYDENSGGMSAALTMGRIGDKEWKRDSKGRIIGLKQVYDTNRSAEQAMKQAGDSFKDFFKTGSPKSLMRAIYKPGEALLAKVQDRGVTTHDVNFSEKVLGFKSEAVRNQEALEKKRPWWDKMGLFGGASAQMKNNSKEEQEFLKKNPGAKLYNKPQKNTGQPYKSKFARSKPKTTPVKPPPKPSAKKTTTPYRGGQRGSGAKPSTNAQKPRTQNPTHSSSSTRTARSTLGINKK